jgi:hypothetical protein
MFEYDFKKSSIPNPPLAFVIHAIDIVTEGKAATFVDSRHRALCDKTDPSAANAEKLMSALKHEFPPNLVDIIEILVQEQIHDLSQLETEGLQTYEQRTARLLHKSREKNKEKGAELLPLEEFALAQIVQAYIQGL